MTQDPRHRNVVFDSTSITSYLADYADALRDALRSVDTHALDRARQAIERAATEGRHVFSIGNGGSAAIADHLCCDFTKGTHAEGHPTIRTQSMNANVALYTAVANDFGFERVFSYQVEMLGRAGDVLIAISSSGNSANIVNAVAAAKAAGMTTIGLSGFSGGALKNMSDIALHVEAPNYGIVEDAHQALCHILAQFIATARDAART